MRMAILGLDVGTSGCKATIVDLNGQVINQASREYALLSSVPGWREIDPDTVWQAVQEAIKEATKPFTPVAPVRAIGISSFGETLVAIDEQGRTLGPSMLYTDTRGQWETEQLIHDLGQEKILSITGTTAQSMYSLSKLMWIKKNKPELYAKTWKWLAFSDFILFRLGAGPYTDYSLATRTLAFDIHRKCWSEDMLGYAGIPKERFGEPVQSGTVVGQLSSTIAKQLQLSEGAMLVAGGHDQVCAALGAGILNPGVAVDGLGSTECVTPVFEQPILTSEMAVNGFACVPHVIPNRYVTYGFTFNCGSLLRWYREQFGVVAEEEAARTGANVYELIIRQASRTPSPLLLLPHFSGAATPYMNPSAYGLLVGLSLTTNQSDIIRALLEGITFEIMVNVEKMEQQGIIINELRAVGGLARSEFYLQLKADMMGKTVISLQTSEAGTLGAVALAGKASGCFSSYEEAVGQLVVTKRRYEPDPANRAWYAQRFEQYKRLYPAVQFIGSNYEISH
jgi:Sugar (pentulose and hexulose) kinases